MFDFPCCKCVFFFALTQVFLFLICLFFLCESLNFFEMPAPLRKLTNSAALAIPPKKTKKNPFLYKKELPCFGRGGGRLSVWKRKKRKKRKGKRKGKGEERKGRKKKRKKIYKEELPSAYGDKLSMSAFQMPVYVRIYALLLRKCKRKHELLNLYKISLFPFF